MLLFYTCSSCFFFKQKTAYEMRISDWSSDVCSSDLQIDLLTVGVVDQTEARRVHDDLDSLIKLCEVLTVADTAAGQRRWRQLRGPRPAQRCRADGDRSEEHTSELQSLMRISYAVCCLKKTIQYEVSDD